VILRPTNGSSELEPQPNRNASSGSSRRSGQLSQPTRPCDTTPLPSALTLTLSQLAAVVK
jgi:hypothetical protein